MVSTIDNLTALYKDARYHHLVNKGYTETEAKLIVNQLTKQMVPRLKRTEDLVFTYPWEEEMPPVPVDESVQDVVFVQVTDEQIRSFVKKKHSDW